MSVTGSNDRKKVTVRSIRKKKQTGAAISMLTAYDYPFARLVDQAGTDIILVGDSLGMVGLGYENTLYVTMDEMVHHCRAVARGATRAMLVGDMPFLSYQVSVSKAVHNAGRLIKEGKMDAVKLEGGRERMEAIQAIIAAGIPVMGHIGLTPQSVHQFGGFLVQGKTAGEAMHLYEDALLLEKAGCYSLVLESIPERLAKHISKTLSIPTIGIGAGQGCDGQVLVTQDMLGLYDQFKPKFVKLYAELGEHITKALSEYRQEVENKDFPLNEHSFHMPDDEWDQFLDSI